MRDDSTTGGFTPLDGEGRNPMPRSSAKLISDLYQRALAVPEPERAAFLDRECSGNPAVLEEVASLLRFERASERFLETPAAAVAATGVGMIGRTLGSYTLTAPLGVGGMGEVYRARDSKLGRDVAIKILPPHFTDDPERRARFAREARVLATLNHPHIGAIYGLEESDGVTGLVLELVEGETLAERLERGPLPTPTRSSGATNRRGARCGARKGDRSPRSEARQRGPAERGAAVRSAWKYSTSGWPNH